MDTLTKRRSDALIEFVKFLTNPVFTVKELPAFVASIFQATASIFLIQGNLGLKDKRYQQDAVVLQSTVDDELEDIGWIHWLPGEGLEGWVGITARRLIEASTLGKPRKIRIPYLPRHPSVECPYHFVAAPLAMADDEIIGLVWLVRRNRFPPFSRTDKRLLQKLKGPISECLANSSISQRFQNVSIIEAIENLKAQIRGRISRHRILELILGHAAELLRARNGSLGIVNKRTGLLKVQVACGSLKGERIPDFPQGAPAITRHVVDTGRSYLCPNVKDDPRYFVSDRLTRSEICVPIKIGNKTIGDINLESQREANFSVEDERLLTFFAIYAAASLVLVPSRLSEELVTLLETGQHLLLLPCSDDHEHILSQTISLAAETLKCSKVSVWLKNTTGKLLILRAASKSVKRFVGRHFYELRADDRSGRKAEGLTGQVAAGHLEKVRVSAGRKLKDSGWVGKYNTLEEGHADPPGSNPLMILPLPTPYGNILGVIKFSRERIRDPSGFRKGNLFTKSDERFGLIYGQQIAVVLSAYAIDRTQALVEISEALILNPHPSEGNEMLTQAVTLARDAIQCERVNMWLKDTAGKRLVLRAACGSREQFIGKLHYDLEVVDKSGMRGEGLTGKVACGSLPIVRRCAAREMKDQGWSGKYNTPQEGHPEVSGSIPILIAPLRIGTKILGVIRFSRPYYRADRSEGFTDADESFAAAVANVIAVAIEVGRLFDQHSQDVDSMKEIVHFINYKTEPLKNSIQSGRSDMSLGIVQHLSSLAGDLKRLIRGDRSELKFVDCSLKEIVDLAVMEQTKAIDKSGVVLEPNYQNLLPHLLRADVVALSGTFSELILNALDAIMVRHPRGGGKICIEASLDDGLKNINVSILDNGCGFPIERVPSVFRSFQSTKPNGTGLGLPWCYKIIERHGGNIWLEPQKEGAKFIVRMPIKLEFDLRVICLDEIQLVIVAKDVRDLLHFKVFDGSKVVTTSETEILGKSAEIERLRGKLADLWSDKELLNFRKHDFIDSLSSIVGTKIPSKQESSDENSQVPGKPPRLIIVAKDAGDLLHFRIFDATGSAILKKSERGISDKIKIDELRKSIGDLWIQKDISNAQKRTIIDSVRSL